MFERILVAVAADAIARAVVAAAGALAGPLRPHLAPVHVVAPAAGAGATAAAAGVGGLAAPGLVAAGAGRLDARLLAEERRRGEAWLRELGGGLPVGLRAAVVLREGGAAAELVVAAREWGAGLIVVGTHGRTGLERLLLGGTAAAVLRMAACPVLVVRAAPVPA